MKVSGQSKEKSSKDGSNYNKLDEDTKTKIEQILLLLYMFRDSFYHERLMTINSLPRSYLIQQIWDDLNKLCHVILTHCKVNTLEPK